MWTSPSSRFVADGVSASMLRTLATALRSGQLALPLNTFALERIAAVPENLAAEIQQVAAEGISAVHLALLLDTAAAAAEARLAGGCLAELVWTGPESVVSHSRDTAVVVEELFASATRSVLVSTFTIQNGHRVFAALAAHLDRCPELNVRLFVHVNRAWRNTREESEILREFADDLASQWPGTRRPEVFYDPRTLSVDEKVRASWHAKCVLVDDEISFVTSANFTEWAQERNVEAGVLVRSRHFAGQLRSQFDALVASRAVHRLPGF